MDIQFTIEIGRHHYMSPKITDENGNTKFITEFELLSQQLINTNQDLLKLTHIVKDMVEHYAKLEARIEKLEQ